MPDRLQPVRHFHDIPQLTPGRARKVEITALGCPHPVAPAKLGQKTEITAGLTGGGYLNTQPPGLAELRRQLPEPGRGQLVLTWMRQYGNTASLGDPLHHLRQFRPVGTHIASLSGSQVPFERLSSIAHHPGLDQGPGKMGPARHITTGLFRRPLQQVRHPQSVEPPGNHCRPGPAIIGLLPDPASEYRIFPIKVQTDNMDRPAFPQTGQFNPGHQRDPEMIRRLRRFSKTVQGIVIGQSQVRHPLFGSTGNKVCRCQGAIRSRAVAVQINAQIRGLEYSHKKSLTG